MENKENTQNNSEESICIICGEQLSFYSIGKCHHKEICYYCTIKNRSFYDDTKCPLCNTNLSLVFICPITEKKSFEDLSKEDLSSYYKWEEDSKDLGIYFTDITSYETALQLNAYKCPIEYCTKTDNFETFEELKNHLFLNHQKIFCKVCIKDGKKFISEQKVYDKNEIKEHNLYGDLEEDIPPHHFCPFCKELFYDDEVLYKHMSNSHFMCDICKTTDKKILFYSALPNLIEHNTLYHYCCPFKDCKEVLYIAFGSKKKLIEHFETKHNQKDNKINEQMAGENLPKILEDPTFYDISLQKDEFNFSDYIKKVNKRCIQYRENKFKSNNNEENEGKNINEDGIEIIYVNSTKNTSQNDDNYHKQKNRIRNNNNNFRGRGRGRGRRFRGNYNLSLQTLKQDFNKYEEDNDSEKEEEEEEEYLKQNSAIAINNFIEFIKKYITERINQKKISPKEINLPKETQYQIIMVIDKTNDYNKFLELFNIQIFGLDWDKINIFKEYIKHIESIKENELFSEFDSLSIKSILVLYKYLTTASKKISGEFYKLDMEQIGENLFDYFSNGVKDEIKNENKDLYQSYESFGLNQNLKEIKSKKNKKNKNKFKWNQKMIPGLTDVLQKKPKPKLTKEQQMKKDFDKFLKKCKEEDEKLEKEKKQENKEEDNNNTNKNNNKSKLSMLIGSNDNKTKNNNKKKIQTKGGFKLSAFNMDEDFPPLK